MKYEVGTMIEIPRAALTADEIAKEADFFCFGTNDLTQMTYGFSRDDAGKFLDAYYDAKIFENDPFAKLDQVGVGKLMEMAIELGKPVNPNLHVGICGEHGGDPIFRRVLQQDWSGLCILLTVPCTDRSSGCCTGCNRTEEKLITAEYSVVYINPASEMRRDFCMAPLIILARTGRPVCPVCCGRRRGSAGPAL